MVIICGYSNDLLAEEKKISIEYYYDEDNPIIDSDNYRKENSINKVTISIYSDDDVLEEQFINYYDDKGRFIYSE